MPNTYYLGTPGDSRSTTVLSDLSISGTLDVGVVESAGAITGTTIAGTTGTFSGFVTAAGVTSSSGVTITSAIPFSFLTRTNENDLSIGQLVLVQRASGLSLIYSSGASIYELAESSVSAAQPTT